MTKGARTFILVSLLFAAVGCGKKDDARPDKEASPAAPGAARLPVAGPPACKPPPAEFPAALADLVARAKDKPSIQFSERYAVAPHSDGWPAENEQLADALRAAGWTVWTDAYAHLVYQGKGTGEATTHSLVALHGTQMVKLEDMMSDRAERHGIKVSIQETLRPLAELAPIPAGRVQALGVLAHGFSLTLEGNHLAELETKVSGFGLPRHQVGSKDNLAFASPDKAVIVQLDYKKSATSGRESTVLVVTEQCREPE